MSYFFESTDRAFLNSPSFHTEASMAYDVYISQDDHSIGARGEIRIRDCHSSVNIELDFHSDEWMKNSEQKIDTMISLLKRAKIDMRKARTVYKREKKKHNAKKADNNSPSSV